jgi:hypothetical protein
MVQFVFDYKRVEKKCRIRNELRSRIRIQTNLFWIYNTDKIQMILTAHDINYRKTLYLVKMSVLPSLEGLAQRSLQRFTHHSCDFSIRLIHECLG